MKIKMKGIIVQCLSSIVLIIASVNNGIVVTWPSYTINTLQSNHSPIFSNVTSFEVGMIGSLPMLGCFLSSLLAGFMAEMMGKKKTDIIAGFFLVISWCSITWATTVLPILVGRFLAGISSGIHIIVVCAYIAEFSEDFIRGTLTSLPSVAYSCGTLISYILGWTCSYHTINFVALFSSMLFTILIFFIRESPVYLFSKGLEKDGMNSLKFYRGQTTLSTPDLLDEVKRIRSQLQSVSRNQYISDLDTKEAESEQLQIDTRETSEKYLERKTNAWRYLWSSKSSQRALLLCILLVVLPVFMGLIAIQTYAGQLFTKAAPSLSPDLCSVILAVVVVLGALVSSVMADFAGRRILVLLSSVLVSASMALLGSLIKWSWAPEWLVPILILSFCFSYNIGVGTIPYILAAESFVPEVKNLALTAIMSLMWISNFIVLSLFDSLTNILGLDGIFFFFSTVGVLTAVIVFIMMPETKGLSNSEIQDLFSR